MQRTTIGDCVGGAGSGAAGRFEPGGRPAVDRAGAFAPASVLEKQHASCQLLRTGEGALGGGGQRDGLER